MKFMKSAKNPVGLLMCSLRLLRMVRMAEMRLLESFEHTLLRSACTASGHEISAPVHAILSSCSTVLAFANMANSIAQRSSNAHDPQPTLFLASCETLKTTLSEHQCRTFANGDARQALEAARRLNEDNRDNSHFRSGMDAINSWILGVHRQIPHFLTPPGHACPGPPCSSKAQCCRQHGHVGAWL
jgi:hypothetical protein